MSKVSLKVSVTPFTRLYIDKGSMQGIAVPAKDQFVSGLTAKVAPT